MVQAHAQGVSVKEGVQAHAQWEFPGLGPGGGLSARGVSRSRPGGCVTQHALRQTPLPHQKATAADGTYPTAMHSCFKMDSQIFQCNVHVDVERIPKMPC